MRFQLVALFIVGLSPLALAQGVPLSKKWPVKETSGWAGTWDLTAARCNVWTGRGSVTNRANETIGYNITVIINRTKVSAIRTESTDGNDCIFFGNLDGLTASGSYYCKQNGGPFKWSAISVSEIKPSCPSEPINPSNHSWSMKEIPDKDIPGKWDLIGIAPNQWTGKGYLQQPVISYDLEVIRTENWFGALRVNPSDNNNCAYFGRLNKKENGEKFILGRYYCSNSGLTQGHAWSAFPKDIDLQE